MVGRPPTIVPAWQRWAPNAPDELMTLCRLSTGATGPTLQVFGQYLGPETHLRGAARAVDEGGAADPLLERHVRATST